MLLRTSTAAPRQSLPFLSQTCLCQTQTRGYKNQLFRHPQVFYQNIVLTDGSSFKVMTSSPRKTYRLTRDKFNNPIWTGRKRSSDEDEQNQRLSKFRKSFSNTLLGEAGLKELSEARRKRLNEVETAGNHAIDELFDILQADDAYVPSKGREIGGKSEETEKEKKKGVRT